MVGTDFYHYVNKIVRTIVPNSLLLNIVMWFGYQVLCFNSLILTLCWHCISIIEDYFSFFSDERRIESDWRIKYSPFQFLSLLNALLGVIGNYENIKKHSKHNSLPVIEGPPCMSRFLLRL